MFKSWRGYEIDGSDSSYNIYSPNKARLIEFVKYYLNLKTIDRHATFFIQSFVYRKVVASVEVGFDELFNAITTACNSDAEHVKIGFQFVAFDKLYPEVKRDIISFIGGKQGETNYTRPVVSDYSADSCIDIYLSSRLISKTHFDPMSLSNEAYVERVLSSEYFVLDICSPIGDQVEVFKYNSHKMQEAFPEFEIDNYEIDDFVNWHGCMSSIVINERLYVKANDYSEVFNLVETDSELTYNYDHFRIEYKRVKMPEKLDNLLFLHELPDLHDYKKNVNNPCPPYDIIYGLGYLSTFMTSSDYLCFIEKLNGVTYFSDYEFKKYTKFYCNITLRGETHKLLISFMRDKGTPIMCMDVPPQILEQVKRKFSMFEVY